MSLEESFKENELKLKQEDLKRRNYPLNLSFIPIFLLKFLKLANFWILRKISLDNEDALSMGAEISIMDEVDADPLLRGTSIIRLKRRVRRKTRRASRASTRRKIWIIIWININMLNIWEVRIYFYLPS